MENTVTPKQDYSKLSTQELKALLIERFDGNAGEILNGFHEMGIRQDKKLKQAITRYLERNDQQQ